MKTRSCSPVVSVRAFTCALLLIAGSAGAQITGINAANSSAILKFIDVNSLNAGNPGSAYTQAITPWTGSTWSLSQTDPTTFDYANGDIAASGAGIFYSVALNNVVLTQPALNTGYADLNFQFTVEYQLGAGGLPSLSTLFPNFLASGTVQSASSSYASVLGSINYLGVNTAGTISVLDTVNYNWFYNTPGTFSNQLITGVPVGGTTPALVANTTLTLVGNLTFEVDPASFSLQTVPEPGSLALAGVAAIGACLIRRRRN